MKIETITRKLKDICAELGKKYSIKMIDLEQIIYRKFNDNYDVEISGLNNNRKKFKANIYVWDIDHKYLIVERFSEILSIDELKEKLAYIENKYGNIN
ncbi:MAG: hypothetical protein PHE12_04860 [Clostridia bacterium]|nr:hypothetical protein [Clostridia bacterium]